MTREMVCKEGQAFTAQGKVGLHLFNSYLMNGTLGIFRVNYLFVLGEL